jgi:hypothetical protein
MVYDSYKLGRATFLEVQAANLGLLQDQVKLVKTEVDILSQLAVLSSLTNHLRSPHEKEIPVRSSCPRHCWDCRLAGDAPKRIPLRGTVEATEVDISPRLAAPILDIVPQEGDLVVTRGDNDHKVGRSRCPHWPLTRRNGTTNEAWI